MSVFILTWKRNKRVKLYKVKYIHKTWTHTSINTCTERDINKNLGWLQESWETSRNHYDCVASYPNAPSYKFRPPPSFLFYYNAPWRGVRIDGFRIIESIHRSDLCPLRVSPGGMVSRASLTQSLSAVFTTYYDMMTTLSESPICSTSIGKLEIIMQTVKECLPPRPLLDLSGNGTWFDNLPKPCELAPQVFTTKLLA